jgi:hypothetical protein
MNTRKNKTKTRQENTHKTRHGKIKQDKTRQDKRQGKAIAIATVESGKFKFKS